MLYCARENGIRAQGKRNAILEGKTEEELKTLGTRHPEFRYKL
jgi:hypothetical protein